MAVTRINNNQISDASTGNTFVGINAAVKLQAYSVTATRIANNLTYGSDLTITGNLTVQGNTTTIDTTYTTIEDPVLLLASNQTGAPSVDIGFVGERGTSQNIAFVWDESVGEFVTVYTTTGETNTTVSIASYADLHIGNGNIGGNAVINGTTSLVGNLIGTVNATGNINGGNLNAVAIVNAPSHIGTVMSASGNITGGNLITGGQVSATGNITTSANIAAGNINITGAITTTGNLNVGNLNATNRVSGATGFFTGNVDVLGNLNATIGVVYANSGIFYGNAVTGNNAAFAGVPGFTQLGSNVVMQFAGNVNSYSQINFENINSGNRASTDYIATADNGNDSVNYVNMGIASSTYDYPEFSAFGPNDAYLHNNGGNLLINNESPGKIIKFVVGGSTSTDLIATLSNTQFSMTGIISASGNVTGSNLNTAGQVVATGNVTGGNIITGGLVTATGNLNTSAGVLATGNIRGGNILTPGLISSTGNITSAANIAGGNLSITSAVNAATMTSTGNLFVGGNLTVQGNITYQNVDDLRVEDPVIIMGTGPNGAPLTSDDGMDRGIYMEYYKSGALGNAFVGWDNSTGNMIAATSVNFSGNNIVNVLAYGTFQTGNIFAQTAVATGNVTGGNIITAGLITATGGITSTANVTGGNIVTAGQVTATGNVSGGNLNVTGNIVDTGPLSIITGASGNIALQPGGTNVLVVTTTGANIAGTASVSGNVTGGNIITAGLITATGNLNTSAGVTATGNVSGGNLITGGLITSTGNITGGNIVTGGQVTATGNITSAANVAGGNVIATTAVSAPSHIGTIVSVTGNVNGGNINTTGVVFATGNVVGGNVNTTSVVGTVVSMSGNITGANLNTGGSNGLTLNASNINSNAGRITINSLDADVDFAVDGSGAGNVFYVDAGARTASFGSSTQTTNAIVAFNATNSILMPVGNTLQRPSSAVTGMLRFNSTLDAVEVYDSDSWTTVGTPTFTVITDDQFTGNGAQTVYTLANAYTTNAVIVSINGVVQIPTSAYSMTGNVLTFTEAPQSGDFIDVRGITTTTQVTSISNSPGTAIVQPNTTLAQVDITGNLIPSANITYNLGSPSARWNELFLAGNTITLGNTVLKNTGGNAIGFFGPDGTTPATIDPASVDTTTIANGTSNVSVASSGGNVRVNVGGTSNVMVVSSSVVAITGDLSVTGNATLSGNILGDRIQNGTTQIDIQTPSGNANVSVSGTSNVAVFATTGVFVTGVASASGNVTGANINTAGLISATGNVNGGNLITAGLITATGAITGAAISGTTISGSGNVTGANINTGGLVSATGNVNGGNLVATTTVSAPSHVGTIVSVSGNITGGNLSVGTGTITVNNIVNGGSNGTGNIGASGASFNTIFAKATSAQYADLAENYCADAEYTPGTVLSFGGEHEVTVSTAESDRRIAGVVSTNPSYIMNSTLECEFVATVALTGRVPTLVTGPVAKGDMMVSAGNGRAMACTTPAIGTVIGKALENHAGGDGVIEVVVGRL